MPSGSVNFDRAAGYYDQTRISRPETDARVVDMLRGELAGHGRCIEIGVGTGRIGLPLAVAGIPMAGVDISANMVARLVEKAGSPPPLLLALADATALPFPDSSFGSAVASHVFHLIPGWRTAVGELIRVVRPGGRIVIDQGIWSPLVVAMRERFAEAAGLERSFVGLQETEELDAEFISRGIPAMQLPVIYEDDEVLVEDLVRRFEEGQYSQTWALDDETVARGSAELRRWAEETFRGEPQPIRREISWHAYDLHR